MSIARRSLSSRAALAVLLCWQPVSLAWASPLFDDNAVLEVTLTGRFGTLLEQADVNEYQPFELHVDGEHHAIRVRLRGHSRRYFCEFPPLRLNFSKQRVAGTLFAGQDKLKLVTHCRNNDRGEQDMLEEFLAYRVLNQLTDLSFRVRLLKLTYRDIDGKLPIEATERYGFVLESEREIAARHGGELAVFPRMPVDRQDPEHAALVYVFQYMIGNTDWQLTKPDYDEACCHNIKLLNKGGRIYLLAYDFDFAGIANTRYAKPNPKLRIKRVTQRQYRGICTEREWLRRAIVRSQARRSDILDQVSSTPGLSERNVDRARAYIDGYFERAEDTDRLLRHFERDCI